MTDESVVRLIDEAVNGAPLKLALIDKDVLEEILDTYDPKAIRDLLKRYSKTIKLLSSNYKKMNREVRIDWALSDALNPDWYASNLISRLQNTMLVSALLLTVTASFFLSPPFPDLDVHYNARRIFFYVDGLCCIFYLLSIYFGVHFIENAMCRGYTVSDRFLLIIDQYHIRAYSQYCMVFGSILFPVTLVIPMWANYADKDAYVGLGFGALYVIVFCFVQKHTVDQADVAQKKRREIFMEKIVCGADEDLKNHEDGHVKGIYESI